VTATKQAADGRAGVEGNRRLTAALGLLLLVMLAVEGVTVLDVRGMLTLHMFLGLMLIPPVLFKSATTSYRFARYYRGAAPYVEKGPPHIVLRLLGPVVVLSSVALLGTGLVLILVGSGQRDTWLTLHQGSFIVWLAAMTIHVLGHVLEAARVSAGELRRDRFTRGRGVRMVAVALALLAGVGLATALWPEQHSASTSGFHDSGSDDH